MLRLTGIGTKPRASHVPTAFGVPLPGLYGVKSASHRSSPPVDGVEKMPFTVNCASRSWAPNAARPGVPAGTSGGGRQVTSLYAPSAASAPVVGSTYIGTCSV